MSRTGQADLSICSCKWRGGEPGGTGPAACLARAGSGT